MNAEGTRKLSLSSIHPGENHAYEKGGALLLLQVLFLPIIATLFFLGHEYSERRASGVDLQLELDAAVTSVLDAAGDAKQTSDLLEQSCINLESRYTGLGGQDLSCHGNFSDRRVTLELSWVDHGVTVSRRSVAIRPSVRTVVVMSNSRSMAPDLAPITGVSDDRGLRLRSSGRDEARDYGWGSAGSWPSSSAWAGLTTNERQRRYRRLITQSCYNPVYSLVKSGAQALQYLQQSDGEPLAVYLSPGNQSSALRGFEVLVDGLGQVNGTREVMSRAKVPLYRSGEVGAGVCAALSLGDLSGRYANRYAAAERKLRNETSDTFFGSSAREPDLINSIHDKREGVLLSEAIHWAPIAADVSDAVEIERGSVGEQLSNAAARAVMAAMSHVLGSLLEDNAGGRRNLQVGWIVSLDDKVPSLGEVTKIGDSLVSYAGIGLPVSVDLFVVENPYKRQSQGYRSGVPFDEYQQIEASISEFDHRLGLLSHNAANFRLLGVASQDELAREIEHSWRARRRASIVE
ncbi:MAG: hypothetical protein PHC51_07425 [bacterium]|nr:hypothetical protein [bacterium]